MKKTLSILLMLCSIMAFAASKTALLFNRPQFQLRKADASYDGKPALTVPLVYAGDAKLVCSIAADCAGQGDNCYVVEAKGTVPLYMTICQPCIDCYPCSVLGQNDGLVAIDGAKTGQNAEVGALTRWNLYIIDVDKKAKTAVVYKFCMLNDAENESVFFTGASKNKAFAQSAEGASVLTLTGAKSDYKFKYIDASVDDNLVWTATGNGTSTAYIKSVSKFTGAISTAYVYGPYAGLDPDVIEAGWQTVGTVTLTRNASLTKKALVAAFGATVSTKTKNWEDCSVEVSANVCEEVFTTEPGDLMDEWLVESAYKKYSCTFITGQELDEILSNLVSM